MRHQAEDSSQSRVFYELSSLILDILRTPSSTEVDLSDQSKSPSRRRLRNGGTLQQITPTGFASLLLGISLALMMCGSVTFFIGFMLMPWVLGLVIVLYFVGVVSSLSMLGRALLCHSSTSVPPSPPTDPSSWKLS